MPLNASRLAGRDRKTVRRYVDAALAAMRPAFGSWMDPDRDGAAWVEQLRSGSRLQRSS